MMSVSEQGSTRNRAQRPHALRLRSASRGVLAKDSVQLSLSRNPGIGPDGGSFHSRSSAASRPGDRVASLELIRCGPMSRR